MFANRFTVVVDACVLVPPLTRNLLLSLAEAELFRLRWTANILDEMERGATRDLVRLERDNPAAAAKEARQKMERAFPEALIEGHEPLLGTIAGLPDENDDHVIAAALHVGAAQIVTDNLRHFPDHLLAPLMLEARSADDFIADTIDLPNDLSTAVVAIRELRNRLKRPALTAKELLLRMERCGLLQTAALLSEMEDLI